MSNSNAFFRRWVIHPIFWLSVAIIVSLTPKIAWIWLLLLAILLFFKVLAVQSGVLWILRHGSGLSQTLGILQGGSADPNERPLRVFEKLARTPAGYAPFGVMDWSLFATIDEFETSPARASKLIGATLLCARDCWFSFESLLVVGALTLALRPYTPNDSIGAEEFMAFANSALLGCLIVMMAVEILVGHVQMGTGYFEYFHHKTSSPRTRKDDRKALLADIGYFSRLVLYSLLAIAAICQSYYATSGGFKGIMTEGYAGEVASRLIERLSLYGEFFAFTCTTFATVGYGDVYPNVVPSRLIVSGIHLLTMGMVLVLLQVVLAQRRCIPDDE